MQMDQHVLVMWIHPGIRPENGAPQHARMCRDAFFPVYEARGV